jgi:hypothetical protein
MTIGEAPFLRLRKRSSGALMLMNELSSAAPVELFVDVGLQHSIF